MVDAKAAAAADDIPLVAGSLPRDLTIPTRVIPKPAPPSSHPVSIPIPDLNSLHGAKDQEGKGFLGRLPDRVDFPKHWAGLINHEWKGFVWIEISVEEFGGELPEPKIDLSKLQGDLGKRGGWYLARRISEVIPTAYPDHAEKMKGSLTVYRIRENKEFEGVWKDPADELQKIDTASFVGWSDSASGTFSLFVDEWESGKHPYCYKTLRNAAISGYWFPKEDAIQGWVNSLDTYVRLSSDRQAMDQLRQLAVAEYTRPSDIRRGAMNQGQELRKALRKETLDPSLRVQVDKLIAWYANFLDQMNDETFDRWVGGDLPHRGMTMISGPEFEKAFGKPYLAMNYQEQYLFGVFIGGACYRIQRGEVPHIPDIDFSWLDNFAALLNVSNDRDRRILRGHVIQQQANEKWYANFQERILEPDQYPGAAANFNRIYPWVLRAIMGRPQNPYEGELANLAKHQKRTAQWRELQAERQQYDHLHQELVAEFEELATLPGNIKTLQQLGKRLPAFSQEYSLLQDSASHKAIYQAAVQFMETRHQQLLDHYLNEVFYQVETAANQESFDALRNWTLVDQTAGTKLTSQALAKHFAKNQKRLEFESKLATYSVQERCWMKLGSLDIEIPEIVPPPSADSIRKAILREFAAKGGNGEITGPQTVMLTTSKAKVLGMYFEYDIPFLKIESSPQDRSPLPKGVSHTTKYRYELGMRDALKAEGIHAGKDPSEIGTGTLLADNPIWKIQQRLLRQESRSTVHQDEFVLTTSGWRNQTMQKRKTPWEFSKPGRGAIDLLDALDKKYRR
ncbi:hypothetical protein [Bremerella alba]|uniref:hypothetical protein n=1 Tax=Bremerella alba TaxID=980252 RepID=UPI001A955272|nr:hypothetical protein [Bremerella alba]